MTFSYTPFPRPGVIHGKADFSLKIKSFDHPQPKKNTPIHPMRGRETACCIWKVKHRISYRSQTIKQKTQLEHVLFENYSELIILLSSQPANLRNWMCNIYHQDIVTQSIKRWQETNCCKHSVGNALRECTCCNWTSTELVLVRTLWLL